MELNWKGYQSLRQQKVPGDNCALDLACSLVNRDYAGVAVHALDFGFAGIAEGAVDLDGFVHDAVDHFGGVEFGFGRGGVSCDSWLVTRGRKSRRTRRLALRYGSVPVFEEGGLVEEGAGG